MENSMSQVSVNRLAQAISSNEIEHVKVAVREELRTGIARLPVEPTEQAELLEALSRLLFPVRPIVRQNIPAAPPPASSPWLRALALFAVTSLLVLVGKLSVLLAVGLAAAAAVALGCRPPKTMPTQASEAVLVLEGSPEQLASEIGKVEALLQDVSESIRQQGDEHPQKVMPLMDAYPNVVRWLQNLYVDSEELQQQQQERIQRSVKTLLAQCYYNVVDYDGTNIHLFATDRSSVVHAVSQLAPAIVDARSGRKALPGSLLFPIDAKI